MACPTSRDMYEQQRRHLLNHVRSAFQAEKNNTIDGKFYYMQINTNYHANMRACNPLIEEQVLRCAQRLIVRYMQASQVYKHKQRLMACANNRTDQNYSDNLIASNKHLAMKQDSRNINALNACTWHIIIQREAM